MLRSVPAAAFALFAILVTASTAWAGKSTDGIVIYSPLEGVTVVTVSTDLGDEGAAAGEAPAVNVINQVNVVNVVITGAFPVSVAASACPIPGSENILSRPALSLLNSSNPDEGPSKVIACHCF